MADQLTFSLGVDTKEAVGAINTFFQTVDAGAAQAKSKLNTAFNQKLETEVKIEFKNGELVAKQVEKTKQNTSKLHTIQKALNGEIAKTPNSLKKQLTILRQLQGDTKKFKNGTRAVTEEWKTLSSRITRIKSEIATLDGSSGGGGGSRGGLGGFTAKLTLAQTAAQLTVGAIRKLGQAVSSFLDTAVRMETLQLQLEAFTGGAQQASDTFEDLVELAANSPFNLEQVGGAAKIMMAFGMETEAAMEATERLAVVAAATGGDINLLGRNMGQIVAQGRAYTRDLTQFAIQGIPIWEQLSVVTGESVSALKDLAKEGRIGGAEVTAALRLMTQQGSAFRQIAERMQETFAGRLARIEASFQQFALAGVNAFNALDKAMGGVVSGGMKSIADGLQSMAEHADTIVAVFGAVAIATAAAFGALAVTKVVAYAASIGLVGLKAGLSAAGMMALSAAVTAFKIAMGPIGLALAIAGAVGMYAFNKIKGSMAEAKTESNRLTQAINENIGATGELTDAERKLAAASGQKSAVEVYKELQDRAGQYKAALERQEEKLKSMKEAINERYDAEKEKIEETMEKIDEKISQEKDSYEGAKAAVTERYDAEISKLQEALDLTREKNNSEIDALRAKTPAEKALYDLEKQKLVAKIRQGGLDQEALLRATARLQRMNRQEQIAKLQVRNKAQEKKLESEIAAKEKEKAAELDKAKKSHKEILGTLEAQKTAEEARFARNEQERDKEISQIDEILKTNKNIGKEVDSSSGAVRRQVVEVRRLAGEYRNAKRAVDELSEAIRRKNAAANNSNSNTPTQDLAPRFAGGPVSGGQSYQVNELGKEAFLSASGKLSMINAPSFGKWKAPGSGTVIPAHLTKQLDVPAGGVNLNQGSASSRAGGGNMISSQSAQSVSNAVTNNVTIQSSNPTQSANNLLVQLQRVRRGRYGR